MHTYVNKREELVQRGLALHRLMCYYYHYINQTQKGFKRMLIYYDTNTQSANFRGNPLCQVTKTTLKQQLNS